MRLFYRRKIHIISIVLMLGLFYQCRLKSYHESQIYGLWMGVHTEFTPVYPLPVLKEYRPDGTITTKRFGKEAKQYNWVLNQSTLTIDTMHYEVINCNKNTLQTRNIYKYLFRRVNDAPIGKYEGELRTFLQNTSWKSEGRELHFDREKVFTVTENKLTEIRCWNIEKYSAYAFLYQTEYLEDCNKPAGRAMQITGISDDELRLSVSNETEKYDLIYTKENNLVNLDSLLKIKPFQRCSMYGIPRIGGVGNLYEGGGNSLEGYFYDNYKTTKNTVHENGFIIIEFIVNCIGETGEFNTIEMDKKYEAHDFHEDISNQLVDLTTPIDRWLPYEYEGNSYDAKTSLNFRIINGQIKVIL